MLLTSVILALASTTLALILEYEFDPSKVIESGSYAYPKTIEPNGKDACHPFSKEGGGDYNLVSGQSANVLRRFGVTRQTGDGEDLIGVEFFSGQTPCKGNPAFFYETYGNWPSGELQQTVFPGTIPGGQEYSVTYFRLVFYGDFESSLFAHIPGLEDTYISYNGENIYCYPTIGTPKGYTTGSGGEVVKANDHKDVEKEKGRGGIPSFDN